jgi:hypothetical protein
MIGENAQQEDVGNNSGNQQSIKPLLCFLENYVVGIRLVM